MFRIFFVSIAMLLFGACSHDPYVKFNQAKALFENGEVLAAEELFRESLAEFEVLADDNALGDVYSHYGAMIASPEYRKHEKSLRELGAYDPTSRRAIWYLMKSLVHYENAGNQEGLRYAAFQLANIYHEDGFPQEACDFYGQSIRFHQKAMQSSHGGVMVVKGYASWEGMVADLQKAVGCPSSALPDVR